MTPEQALSESWQILFGCEFHPESLAAKELLEIIHAQRAEAVEVVKDELERTRAAAKELREAYKYLVKHSSPILNLNLDGCEDGAPKLYSYSANCRTFIQHLLKETKWLEDLG